jgi:hypothetical protein
MDIALSTSSPTATLEFRQLQRFGDGSGFATFLVIRSGAFAAALPFHFEPDRLSEFISALESMDRTLKGEATLKPTWEPQFLSLELDGSGHVRVFGEPVESSEHEQRLHFSFLTDQTCLRPLASRLKACQSMAAI